MSREQPSRSVAQRLAYRAARQAARLAFTLAFGIRCTGRERYPRQGGALVCANHQSHLDPVLVGLTCDRRLNYVARKSLFRFPGFGRLIRFMDAIAIDRDGFGLSGIKEAMRRLRRGEMVLIFPEGTRTKDGSVSQLKPGFCSLARRSNAPIVPVGFDGAYDAWPRWRRLPRPASIHVDIGEPISTETIRTLSDGKLVEEVHRRILDCHEFARRSRPASAYQP